MGGTNHDSPTNVPTGRRRVSRNDLETRRSGKHPRRGSRDLLGGRQGTGHKTSERRGAWLGTEDLSRGRQDAKRLAKGSAPNMATTMRSAIMGHVMASLGRPNCN